MGNGFKRFTGMTPLALKSLNDQLEQLWLKVMGGIRLKDMDKSTQKLINDKVGREDVVSVIEQSTEEILMSVGRGGGDNVLSNGDFAFGMDGWGTVNADIDGDYCALDAGQIKQTGIKIIGGRSYTLGLEGFGGNAQAKVYGQYPGQSDDNTANLLCALDIEASAEVKKHKISFEAPLGIAACCLVITTDSVYRLRRIYIREGANVDEYTSNPNEIIGSGISIREGSVNISAQRLNLEVLDESGKVKSLMSAGGNGFDTMQCSELLVGGRPYNQKGALRMFVNSETGSDTNNGRSTYTPFKTIKRAMQDLPMIIEDTCNIYLSGGTYYEDINFNKGGMGLVFIVGQNATLYGSLRVYGSSYTVSAQSLKIYSDQTYGIYGYGATGYLDVSNCLVDCNSGGFTIGISSTRGFRMYVRDCEVNNCETGIQCSRGSYMNLQNCTGRNNLTGVDVEDMSLIHVDGTVPLGDVISNESDNSEITGMLIGAKAGSNYELPRDAIKVKNFYPVKMFSIKDGEVKLNELNQGGGSGGFAVFNTANIRSVLLGKTIKDVKLNLKRSDSDENARDGIIKVYTHNLADENEDFSYVKAYGDLGALKRGQEASVALPIEVLQRLVEGSVKGLLFYDASDDAQYCFSLDNTANTMYVEVRYV
ncbi:MAG: hypothetical protein IJR47_05355 [Clostridia bacterium]|nr:hypothetical protein [Clostridia bacterium]